MKKIAFLLVAAAATFAMGLKPYVLVDAGMTFPKFSMSIDAAASGGLNQGLDMTFGPPTNNSGFVGTVGFGLRAPVTEQLDVDASAGLTYASLGMNSKVDVSGPVSTSGGIMQVQGKEDMEFSFSSKLFDLSAGLDYHLTPQFAVEAGAILTVPLSSSMDTKVAVTSISACTSTGTCTQGGAQPARTTSGTLKSDQTFFSIKLGGEFNATERLGLTAEYDLPVANYFDETTDYSVLKASFSRALVGIKYNL